MRISVCAVLLGSLLFAGCRQSAPSVSDIDESTAPIPDTFLVKLETTKGDVYIEVHRDWSPRGAARFHELVELGFYDECRFFRVIEGFMAQVGINGDPNLHAKWDNRNIKDDQVKKPNQRGYVSFAKTGAPDSRSTQFFINFKDNSSSLDGQGFSPFGRVVEGMDVVDSLYSEYGEGSPGGFGPNQSRIVNEGNEYLDANFPRLDHIIKAEIVEDE